MQQLVLQVGGWAAGQSPATVKLLRITETLDTANNELRRRTVDIPDDPEIAVVENMMLEDQSRKDVHKSITIPAVSFTTPKDTTNIGCWNVRTLYTTGKAAQVAREMNNYKCDILGLSEVRWTGSGRIKLASGESMIFSGRDDEIHREGVALMLTCKAARALMEWNPVNGRIITARFYSRFIKTTVIQVYAPTNDYSDEDKDAFYEQLQATWNKAPKHDVKIVMGDFNAKVGESNQGHEEHMGTHGLGVRNDNGRRLIEFCEENNLVISGTIFPHKMIHKATWTSPDGKTQNQIDHILISRQSSSLLDTRAMRGADANSDHYLLKAKFQLKLRRKMEKESRRRRFNIAEMADNSTKANFSKTFRSKMSRWEEGENPGQQNDDENTIEKKWEQIKTSYIQTAEETLGYKQKGQKPWISDDTWRTVQKRKQIKQKIENSKSVRIKNQLQKEYKEADKDVKRQMRADKRKWLDKKCEDAELAANNGRLKETYEIIKSICNEKRKSCQTVKDKVGNILTDNNSKLERWKEHFEETLNRPEPTNPIEINDDECSETIDEITTTSITQEEIKKALKI